MIKILAWTPDEVGLPHGILIGRNLHVKCKLVYPKTGFISPEGIGFVLLEMEKMTALEYGERKNIMVLLEMHFPDIHKQVEEMLIDPLAHL